MNGKWSEAKKGEARAKGNVCCYFFNNGLIPDPVVMAKTKYLQEVKIHLGRTDFLMQLV